MGPFRLIDLLPKPLLTPPPDPSTLPAFPRTRPGSSMNGPDRMGEYDENVSV